MNNTQSNTDMKHDSNYHDSLGYYKTKPNTVTFAIDIIQGVTCRGPNLRDQGNNANNDRGVLNCPFSLFYVCHFFIVKVPCGNHQ